MAQAEQAEGHPAILPAIESIELDTQPSSGHSWHPKVTAYRLSFTAVTLGLGTSKAITSTTKGCGSAMSTTIEWISGVVVLLVQVFRSSYSLLDLFTNNALSELQLVFSIPI
jgi:hypothetical protein